MERGARSDTLVIPHTAQEAANWLRMLTREVNTFVLFLQTWSAMGFVVRSEVASSLVGLQSKVMEARSSISRKVSIDDLRGTLEEIASHEEEVYGQLTEEIKRFKEESEGIFPAFKLNFDPCF